MILRLFCWGLRGLWWKWIQGFGADFQSRWSQEVIEERVGIQFFFSDKKHHVSCAKLNQKWPWKLFFLLDWWMKIQSFGRVEGRVFFIPLSKSVSPQQKELVFWGAKVQKAHVPAMIDQIWAGCIRCGEHATLACVLRNSQLHNSWIFVKGYTQWHCRWSSGVTKCIRACSEAIHSHLSYLFGVLSDQCLAGSQVLLASCSTFSRRRLGGFLVPVFDEGWKVPRGEQCSIGCFSCWWFELILSTFPFLWQSFS